MSKLIVKLYLLGEVRGHRFVRVNPDEYHLLTLPAEPWVSNMMVVDLSEEEDGLFAPKLIDLHEIDRSTIKIVGSAL